MSSDGERVPVIVPWILLAGLGAAILLTNWMQTSRAADDFPAEVDGLSVVTVSRANEVRDAATAGKVAIEGWFILGPTPPCLPPEEGVAPPTMLEDPCRPQATLLGTADAERGLDVLLDGPSVDWGAFGEDGWTSPATVVFVGHFDDPRAADCAPENLDLCADVFVVTDVPWKDGRDLP